MGEGKGPGNTRPPDQSYAEAAKNRTSFKMYHEQVSKARKTRNKIEIRFYKGKNDEESGAKYIDVETISSYIFDELGVDPDEIDEIDLSNGNNGVKQITFKSEVNTE